MDNPQNELIVELAKVKAIFQLRAICGAVFCDICGDHHEADKVPYSCQTGDGV